MPNYAMHDGARVLNVIVAETVELAETLTGLQAIETDGAPWLDWTLEVEGWRAPAPYESWLWDVDLLQWTAPVPMPTDGDYYWDETAGAWVELVVSP